MGGKVSRLLFVLLIVTGLGAQDTTKGKYQPSETQMLRLQIHQKDAQIAQKDLFIAQQNFQQSLHVLDAEADKIKQENKWPATLLFSQDNLSFTEPGGGK